MSDRSERLKAALKPDFGSWWFLAGGHLHGLWKRKQYSQIKYEAQTLPMKAWKEHEARLSNVHSALEKVLASLEASNCVATQYAVKHAPGVPCTRCDALATLDAALEGR